MWQILSLIIPLDFASTISPIIFALAIFLLSQQYYPKEKVTFFFFGSLLVGIIITLIGFSLGQEVTTGHKNNTASGITDLIIGVIFILFAIRSLLIKDRKLKMNSQSHDKKRLKWFGIGFLVNITNFDAVFLNLTAAKEVGIAQQLALMSKFFLLGINLLFFTLPVTLPVILSLLFPVTAKKALTQINFYLIKYGRYLVAVLFIILGIIFLQRGIGLL